MHLRAQRIEWAEDPSNDDTAFDRIKARQRVACARGSGHRRSGLAVVAEQMAKARKALNWQTFLAARDLVTLTPGQLFLKTAHAYPA